MSEKHTTTDHFLAQKAAEWIPISTSKRSRDNDLKRIITSTSIFHDLPSREWKIISSFLHFRSFEPGEVIFESGTPGLGMYIILEGRVSIIEEHEEADVELAELAEGDFFGEMSLIDELNRSATARASTNTRLAGFFRPQLQQLIHQRPKLGVIILERLAKIVFTRLRISNKNLADAQTEIVRMKENA